MGAAAGLSEQACRLFDEPEELLAPAYGGQAEKPPEGADFEALPGVQGSFHLDLFRNDFGTFSGVSPFEHLSGNAAALEKAPSALHLSVGSFGAVPALTDTLYNKGEILGVGGTDLISQAVGTVSADAVYVGEQYAEIPDALDKTEKKSSALLAMDVMRWVVIMAIVVFAGFGLSGL